MLLTYFYFKNLYPIVINNIVKSCQNSNNTPNTQITKYITSSTNYITQNFHSFKHYDPLNSPCLIPVVTIYELHNG